MNVVEYSLCISVIAFVYAEILTDETIVFGKIYSFLEKHLPQWLFDPIIGCSKCVAGEIALWHYLLTHVKAGCFFNNFFIYGLDYKFDYHILLICLSILTTKILKESYSWMKKKAWN